MSRSPVDSSRVRRNFSRQAQEYDRYAHVQKRVAVQLLRLIGQQGAPVGPALDVGTGTGFAAHGVCRQWPDLPLVLSDIAHGMTAHACAGLPAAFGVDVDAQALPFRSDQFGLVFSSSVFQWINDLQGCFAETARILKPGGVFAFAMYGRRTLHELRDAHERAIEETGRRGGQYMQTFPDESLVRLALECAGLTIETLFSADEVERHPDVPSLLKGLKKIGAQNASRARPSGLASRRTTLRLIDHYTRAHGHRGDIPATYHVIYARARLA